MNSLSKSFTTFYASSIGKKWVVAITGLVFIGFLLGHLIGNLLIFLGPDALNEYAVFLHSIGHGMGIWVARIVLLVSLILHVVTTIQLVRQNRAARAVRYQHEKTIAASKASRTMAISGLIVLVFVIYHILHFTVGLTTSYYDPDGAYYLANGDHNVYKMVVDGFQNILVSGFYILAMALLSMHLSHGFSSAFQTLGLRTKSSWPAIHCAGKIFAAFIFVGNCSIPISVLLGVVK
jgi:succinate dehydrogenase / fumarate reductase cytochrome b subunit